MEEDSGIRAESNENFLAFLYSSPFTFGLPYDLTIFHKCPFFRK
jgi:hypothetical protein